MLLLLLLLRIAVVVVKREDRESNVDVVIKVDFLLILMNIISL